MESTAHFFEQHEIVLTFFFTVVVSAAIRALPDPQPMGSRFYSWAYQFSHLLLANLDKYQSARQAQSGKPEPLIPKD